MSSDNIYFMNKIFLIISLIFLILSVGCQKEIIKYQCKDNTIVDDFSKCAVEEPKNPYEIVDCINYPYFISVEEKPNINATIAMYSHPDLPDGKLYVNITFNEYNTAIFKGEYLAPFLTVQEAGKSSAGMIIGNGFKRSEQYPKSHIIPIDRRFEAGKTYQLEWRFEEYLGQYAPAKIYYAGSFCLKINNFTSMYSS
jgi:hypothetical protein